MRRIAAKILLGILHKQRFVLKTTLVVIELELGADSCIQISHVALIKTTLEKFGIFERQFVDHRKVAESLPSLGTMGAPAMPMPSAVTTTAGRISPRA